MNGFSPDGFIIDQDAFSAYRYRNTPSNINGCGWIAAFNLRRALDRTEDWDAVRREMDAMIRLRIPGPTPMRVMRAYVRRYAQARYTAGRSDALRAVQESRAGILRYWEGREPHFIAFLRQPDGRFRFLNVTDGMEDVTRTAEDFFAERCGRGSVRTLTVS